MSGHLRYVLHVPEEDYDDIDGRRFIATASNFDESHLLRICYLKQADEGGWMTTILTPGSNVAAQRLFGIT